MRENMVGRNQACPCGSGKKFKKCCINKPRLHPDGTHYRLFVELGCSAPRVWRRFLLRSDANFLDLHQAIQSLAWNDEHLFEFVTPNGGTIYECGVQRGRQSRSVAPRVPRLDSYFEDAAQICAYIYDFGDMWRHGVRMEGLETHAEPFGRALLGGAGDFPPEDCGGTYAFEYLRQLREHGAATDDDRELLERHSFWLRTSFDFARERKSFGVTLEGRPTERDGEPGSELFEVETEVEVEPVETASRVEAPATRRPESPLTSERADAFFAEARAALDKLAIAHGLTGRIHAGSSSAWNLKFRYEAATRNADGITFDHYAEDYIKYAGKHGLSLADLHRPFRVFRKTLRIVGLRRRAKLPVVCQEISPDGQVIGQTRISVHAALHHLAEDRANESCTESGRADSAAKREGNADA